MMATTRVMARVGVMARGYRIATFACSLPDRGEVRVRILVLWVGVRMTA